MRTRAALAKHSATGLALALAAITLGAPSPSPAQPREAQSAYRPPSPDPRNIAGAYQPQTSTTLLPDDGSKLPSNVGLGAAHC